MKGLKEGTKILKYASMYYKEEHDTITLYFVVKKSMLRNPKEYPDAVAAMLSLEFPKEIIEARYADICISPIDEKGECFGWEDISLPYDEIDELIELATEIEKAKNNKVGGTIYG